MLKPVLTALLLLPLPTLADTAPRCAVLAQKALTGWAQVLTAQDAGTEKDALDRLTNVVSLHNGLNCQPSALAEAMDCVALQARAGHAVDQAAETCLQKADLAPPSP